MLLKRARVNYDYNAAEADELSIKKGEVIDLLPQGGDADEEWLMARNPSGRIGMIPSNFISVLSSSERTKVRPALPPNWVMAVDNESHEEYYYNTVTGMCMYLGIFYALFLPNK